MTMIAIRCLVALLGSEGSVIAGKTNQVAWNHCSEMIRRTAILAALGCAVVATAGAALSQSVQPSRASASSRAVVPGRAISAAENPAPLADLSEMRTPLNAIRLRAGVGALAWSRALAADANKIATAAADQCTYSSSKKAVGSTPSIFYWAPGVRRIDGEAIVQNLRPSFIVAEWRKGGENYNPATGVCRRPGSACSTFARIATPLSKSVGCARVICPSQAQVWVCKFGDS